jgi:hypothetical protein
MNRFSSLLSFIFAASLTLVTGSTITAQALAHDGGPSTGKPDTVDATKNDASNHSDANSSACFFAAAHGKTITEAPCDVRTLRVSAKEGLVHAQNQLGLVSALVAGRGIDIRQARSRFEKAARRGYAPAQVNLAVTYINGWGTEQNYGAALNWLNAAAKQGHPSAYANLGILYMNGWGVRRDYAEAFKYLQLAANASDAGAQSNLGYLYDVGLGVVQDYSAALRGIVLRPKTATLSDKIIWPIFICAEKVSAKVTKKPLAGSKKPLSRVTPALESNWDSC